MKSRSFRLQSVWRLLCKLLGPPVLALALGPVVAVVGSSRSDRTPSSSSTVVRASERAPAAGFEHGSPAISDEGTIIPAGGGGCDPLGDCVELSESCFIAYSSGIENQHDRSDRTDDDDSMLCCEESVHRCCCCW